MASLTVTIIDPFEKEYNVQLPDAIPVERLMPVIIERLNLTGQPGEYKSAHLNLVHGT